MSVTTLSKSLQKYRKKRGLTLQVLGDLAGVSKQTISKYENGLKVPSPSTLQKIATVLDIHPSKFFEEERIDIMLESIEFRNSHAIHDLEESEGVIKEEVLEQVVSFLQLSELLNEKVSFENPLEDFLIRTENDVEKAAKTLRKRWKLGKAPIYDLTSLLENKGILVVEIDFNENFTGLSGFVQNEIPVITVNRNSNDITRKRFTLAHELAHIVLNFEEDIKARVETLCNYFAGAILLVDEAVIDEVGRGRTKMSLQELLIIKSKYGISVQAIMIRVKSLGLISYRTSKEWWEEYDNWRVANAFRELEDSSQFLFKERPVKFRLFLSRAISENRITWDRASELARTNIEALKRDLNQIQFAF